MDQFVPVSCAKVEAIRASPGDRREAFLTAPLRMKSRLMCRDWRLEIAGPGGQGGVYSISE